MRTLWLFLLTLLPGTTFASEGLIFPVVGQRIALDAAPNIRGKWFIPGVKDAMPLNLDGKVASVWVGQRRCGFVKRKVAKAFQIGEFITIETGESISAMCPTVYGSFFSINLATKDGTYGLKASKDSNLVASVGFLSID